MSDERTGRELTPHDEGASPAPVSGGQVSADRFSAGERSHTVGLTEERGAQVVRQSSNARHIAFLAILVIAIFIPVYWFYDLGIPALGIPGRMEKTAEKQMVTDVQRGYALYIANCARCHGENGQGGVGPPLNDQMRLYDTVTATGASGTGHLNPRYLTQVMEVGGRLVCGDPNSVMPAWREPAGPLNYREVEELVTFLTASSDISFEYDPNAGGHGAADPDAQSHTVTGWRDPNFQPAPGSTPVPACWRPWENPAFASSGSAAPTPGAIEEPGTPDAPRVIEVDLNGSMQIDDTPGEGGERLTAITVKAGETIEFQVTNSAGFPHNFFIGPAAELSAAAGDMPDAPGVPEFNEGTQTFTWTVPEDATDLQFACTVLGHYNSMHGDIVIQP
ncbi:MAG: c-type cytochrome [Chloroflexi bacterium]|nr:c-type cytochrome [Chloroflexota bacterium]